MADQLTSSGGSNSAIVPEIWSANFQDNLRNADVLSPILRHDYENEIQSLGDTVNIPSIPDVTATDLAEGAVGETVSSTATTTPLAINTMTSVDFKITTQAQLQSVAFIDELEKRALSAIQLKMQSNAFALISPSTATPDHVIAYDSASTLADADLLEALDLEVAANWPDNADKYLVTGGLQRNDLVNISKFYDKDTNDGDAPSITGQILAPIYGHNVRWSGAAGTTTYLFLSDFMQIAVQRGLTMKLYDIGVNGERGYRLNIDVLYGIKQMHNDRVITIG
jgi:hypothetical protein